MDIPICWGRYDPLQKRCTCEECKPCGLYFYRSSHTKKLLYRIRLIIHRIQKNMRDLQGRYSEIIVERFDE